MLTPVMRLDRTQTGITTYALTSFAKNAWKNWNLIMTDILAIDPGTTKSGWVFMVNGKPVDHGWFDNEKVYTLSLIHI